MLIIANLDFSMNAEEHFLKNHNYPPSPWIVNRIQNSVSGSGPSRTYDLFIKYQDYIPNLMGGEPITNWEECPKFVIDPKPVKLLLPGEQKNKFFSFRSASCEVDILLFLCVVSEPRDGDKFKIEITNGDVILMKFGRDRISVSGHALIRIKNIGFVDITLGESRKRVYPNKFVNY